MSLVLFQKWPLLKYDLIVVSCCCCCKSLLLIMPLLHCFVSGCKLRNQCDQMARSFFNIWPFTTVKVCPKAHFCQILNESSKNCPSVLKFDQRGQILHKYGHTIITICNNPNINDCLSMELFR